VNAVVGPIESIHIASGGTTTTDFLRPRHTFLNWGAKEETYATTFRPWANANAAGAYANYEDCISVLEQAESNIWGKFKGASLFSKMMAQIEYRPLMDLANDRAKYGDFFYANFVPYDAEGIRQHDYDFGTEIKSKDNTYCVHLVMRDEWEMMPYDIFAQILSIISNGTKRYYEFHDRRYETLNMLPSAVRYADITAALTSAATSYGFFAAADNYINTIAAVDALDHIGDGRVHTRIKWDTRRLDPTILTETYHAVYNFLYSESKPAVFKDKPVEPATSEPADLERATLSASDAGD
jgi:hypothetical protein